jgi:hypothetical protein
VADDAAMTSAGVAVLLLTAGTLQAFDPASAKRLWDTPALGLPAPPLVEKQGEAAAVFTVPEASGFVPRDALTGEVRGEPSDVEGLPAGGVATAVGPVIVHQLPDRVDVYR